MTSTTHISECLERTSSVPREVKRVTGSAECGSRPPTFAHVPYTSECTAQNRLYSLEIQWRRCLGHYYGRENIWLFSHFMWGKHRAIRIQLALKKGNTFYVKISTMPLSTMSVSVSSRLTECLTAKVSSLENHPTAAHGRYRPKIIYRVLWRTSFWIVSVVKVPWVLSRTCQACGEGLCFEFLYV